MGFSIPQIRVVKGMPVVRHKPPVNLKELEAANVKATAEAIAYMAKGDHAKKTQAYYNRLFYQIESSRAVSPCAEMFINPRTGAQIYVNHIKSPEIVSVRKGGESPTEFSIFDWGDIGLIKAVRTKFNDGRGYCHMTNSKLQRFNKISGEWEDFDLTKRDAYKMVLRKVESGKGLSQQDKEIAKNMYLYFRDKNDRAWYGRCSQEWENPSLCPWLSDPRYEWKVLSD